MKITGKTEESIDWSLTTWEGSRHEQLRRWKDLPLENIISALEEMAELSQLFEKSNDGDRPGS